MVSNLIIKYIQKDENNSDYDLGSLGESFSGLNSLFKDLFEISHIDGELIIKTTGITAGSIDVNNVLQLITTTPFHNVHDLLNFLQVTDIIIYTHAQKFFSEFGNIHKSVNDYFRENQLDLSMLTILCTVLITKLFESAGKQKKQITVNIGKFTIPELYATKLRSMVVSGKFKRALKPISENTVSVLQISSPGQYQSETSVDESNLGNYLPEDEKILPELENGQTHNFTGEILALQSTRGESLKFKVYEVEERYQLLTAHPDDDKQTEDYKEYYKMPVKITAEIYRMSLYKKPDIIIKNIELLQPLLI